jgi:hypothetical protein
MTEESVQCATNGFVTSERSSLEEYAGSLSLEQTSSKLSQPSHGITTNECVYEVFRLSQILISNNQLLLQILQSLLVHIYAAKSDRHVLHGSST